MPRDEIALLRLLRDERQHLLKGDLPALQKLDKKKVALLEKLNGSIDSPEVVKLASQNQKLIDATMRGITAVRDRLAALQEGVTVDTYSAHGHRQSIAAPFKKLEKRA